MAAPERLTYFLPPNWTTPAVGGPIQLGNLLNQPLLPHRSILTVGEDDADFPTTYSFEETNWYRNVSSLFNIQLKLEASLTGVVENMVQTKSNSSNMLALTAGKVTTIAFKQDPTHEALVRLLSDPRVQQVMRSRWRKTVLYMVTGIQIASELQFEHSDKKAKSAEAKLTVPVAAVTGVDFGAGGSVASERDQEGSSVAQTETILGYQLLEISVRRGKIKTKEIEAKMK